MGAWIITALLIVIAAAVLMCVFACCKVSGKCSEIERKAELQQADDPCENCLRWSECNGVDEQCPRRKGSKRNEQN